MVDLKSQAVEKGSGKKRAEIGLEEPQESRGACQGFSGSVLGGLGRGDMLMGSGQTLQCLESDSSGPAVA